MRLGGWRIEESRLFGLKKPDSYVIFKKKTHSWKKTCCKKRFLEIFILNLQLTIDVHLYVIAIITGSRKLILNLN